MPKRGRPPLAVKQDDPGFIHHSRRDAALDELKQRDLAEHGLPIGMLYQDDQISMLRSAAGVVSVFTKLPVKIARAYPKGFAIVLDEPMS